MNRSPEWASVPGESFAIRMALHPLTIGNWSLDITPYRFASNSSADAVSAFTAVFNVGSGGGAKVAE